MSDIVDRLRNALQARYLDINGTTKLNLSLHGLIADAADEIERLRQWQDDACDWIDYHGGMWSATAHELMESAGYASKYDPNPNNTETEEHTND